MSSGLSWQNHPPEKLLAECFHISTGFHPRQHDIIEQLVQGKRVLAIPAQAGENPSVTRWPVSTIPTSPSSFLPSKRSCGTNASAVTKPMPSPPLSSVPTLAKTRIKQP